MKWPSLPGPANFISDVVDQLRDGISVIVAAPTHAPGEMATVFAETLRRDHWSIETGAVDGQTDPLRWLTELLYLEPEQWVGWSVEKLFKKLPDGRAIVIEGVTASTWEPWRSFLMDFEVASRGHASGLRPVLLVVVRGVPRKRLQAPGAALALRTWHGVFGELDTLIYVDQRLRAIQKPARHHKLLVRLIAALALWDLDLADFLMTQPEQELFEPKTVLQAGRYALHREDTPIGAEWECGGVDQFDGVEMVHSFVLLDQGDKKLELARRLWSAQAAELLPLIELRRRELAKGLERHVKCPFWLGGDRQVRSLDELEIGPLAHVARTNAVDPALRDRADRLAEYRNTLAHLQLLGSSEALDSRLHA
jgi:hypothetical protein